MEIIGRKCLSVNLSNYTFYKGEGFYTLAHLSDQAPAIRS